MFVAIPKIDDTIEPGFYYLCLIAKSKAQARRILTQSNKNPAEHEILELKEKKEKKNEKSKNKKA